MIEYGSLLSLISYFIKINIKAESQDIGVLSMYT